jgi:hypothetical protein
MKLSKRISKSSVIFIKTVFDGLDNSRLKDDLIGIAAVLFVTVAIPFFVLTVTIFTMGSATFKNDFTIRNLFESFLYTSAIELVTFLVALSYTIALEPFYQHLRYNWNKAWYETSSRGIAQKLMK